MGKVLVIFQIMPESTDVDLNEMKDQIEKLGDIGEVKDIKEEPIAFGLKCLKLLTMIDDAGGLTEKIQDKLKSVSGVKDVEITDVTLA